MSAFVRSIFALFLLNSNHLIQDEFFDLSEESKLSSYAS